METPLVIYHAQCRDGWASAWAAAQAYPGATLLPASYGMSVPEDLVRGRDVIVADFSWKRADMKRLILLSRSTKVYDHHKTAEAELSGILDELQQIDQRQPGDLIVFDMNRSGAGIVWDEMHDPLHLNLRPWLIDYVEDRDLWRWKLHSSRKVNAYISTLPYGKPEHLSAWDEVVDLPLGTAIERGAVALQAIKRYAEAVCENARSRSIGLPGIPYLDCWHVPSVNAPQHDISEVLEHLMDLNPDAPFVHGWWQRADGMFAQSFRSRGDFDVSIIAKAYGGGGHKNAAGAQTAGIL